MSEANAKCSQIPGHLSVAHTRLARGSRLDCCSGDSRAPFITYVTLPRRLRRRGFIRCGPDMMRVFAALIVWRKAGLFIRCFETRSTYFYLFIMFFETRTLILDFFLSVSYPWLPCHFYLVVIEQQQDKCLKGAP